MKVDLIVTTAQDSPIICMQPEGNESVDSTTFAPFILICGNCTALILFDFYCETKAHIFKERAGEGWTGNGRDWNSVAEVVIAEQLPQLADAFTFDSDASFFAIAGTKTNLTVLGHALKIVFDDDHILRDILFRARLQD
ncbi:Imm51 family immunity protein [Collimonas sp.]|jgi:hypothetical protein|uniref:Imm51 family immunity protein n=1 Tax=Collimonas sp. TaxID=1963772 RepID=UPI002BFF6728|nr:Imm51 family immunity protein [Collimonas sp.]HWW06380.1 Imm51 family immunity protein [Collimonas sp.]